MTNTPAHTRKVLYAMSEAERDSLLPEEIAELRNRPGVDILVIDGESTIGDEIVQGVLARYTVRSGDVLIQNPYSRDVYLAEDDVESELAIEKATRVAHIAHLLGSTSVRMVQATGDVNEDRTHVAAAGGAKGVVAKLTGSRNHMTEFERRIALLDESTGGEANIDAARSYLTDQNLAHDTMLSSLVEKRAVPNNTLTKRVLTVDATREARSSLEIAADLAALKIGKLGGNGEHTKRTFGRLNVEYEITFNEGTAPALEV